MQGDLKITVGALPLGQPLSPMLQSFSWRTQYLIWRTTRRPDVDCCIGEWAWVLWRWGFGCVTPFRGRKSHPERTAMLSLGLFIDAVENFAQQFSTVQKQMTQILPGGPLLLTPTQWATQRWGLLFKDSEGTAASSWGGPRGESFVEFYFCFATGPTTSDTHIFNKRAISTFSGSHEGKADSELRYALPLSALSFIASIQPGELQGGDTFTSALFSDTIPSARVPSTRWAYDSNWALFVEWCSSHQEDSCQFPIRVIFSFLQDELERRLSLHPLTTQWKVRMWVNARSDRRLPERCLTSPHSLLGPLSGLDRTSESPLPVY